MINSIFCYRYEGNPIRKEECLNCDFIFIWICSRLFYGIIQNMQLPLFTGPKPVLRTFAMGKNTHTALILLWAGHKTAVCLSFLRASSKGVLPLVVSNVTPPEMLNFFSMTHTRWNRQDISPKIASERYFNLQVSLCDGMVWEKAVANQKWGNITIMSIFSPGHKLCHCR